MARALVVGGGVSGLLHALALRAAGVSIEGVVDPNLPQAELLTSLVGGIATSSFEIAREWEVDVAAICSPPSVHVAQAIALARRGRLVFVEKPVALGEHDLGRLRELPSVVPIVQWRAGRSARMLRALFAAEAFGPAPRLSIDLRAWRDDAYFMGGRRGLAQWGCGAMTSIGIHAVDLALHAVGRKVVSWQGREVFGRPAVDVPTGGSLTIGFEGGAVAVVSITLDAPGCNDLVLAARGPSGSALLAASEGDPTAAPLELRGEARRIARQLPDPGGAGGSPLLVPFVKEALDAHRRGESSIRVDDVAEAHTLVLGLAASTEIVERAG
ncbi:MAG: Gfo/Idh/MocA family oxidoreductase [Deltaproteobacteria bacterium]|nr:Gfo/Idh/MocA family oxidoreductase [Deltaproteobacteria bacterium]